MLLGDDLIHDVRGKAPGRGAWVMPQRDCLEKACKGGFARSFKQKVSAPPVEALIEQMREAIGQRLKEGVQVGVRARQLAIGAEALSEAMREGRVRLVWIAPDAGESTKQKFRSNAERKALQVVEELSGGELGGWLGREFVAVMGVCDAARAERMTRDLRNLKSLEAFEG